MQHKTKKIDSGRKCRTKYPIVFSYAFGGSMKYSFGRILKVLKEEGAEAYMANKHAFQSHMHRAKELKREILDILAVSEKPKVNIICHCQGGLDSRYMIANLGMSDKVASWTGITSGHQGLLTFDFLNKFMPNKYMKNIEKSSEDINPDCTGASICIGKEFMRNIFNKNTPNQPPVYYQTWTAQLKGFSLRQLEHYPTYLLTKILEGDNDGYVSLETSKWGNFRGIANKNTKNVSHYDMVDHQEDFVKIKGFDILNFYINLASELKKMGF